MPRTINADGRTITVPDDATPEEINEIVGPAPAASVGGNLRPLTEREQMETTYPVGAKGETLGENVHNSARNAFTGAYGVLAHPVSTVGNILKSITPAPIEEKLFGTNTPNPIQSLYEGLNTRPGETISTAVGQTAATAGMGEVGGSVARAIPKVAESGVRAVTGTSPRVVSELVKNTKAENVAAVDKATAETAKNETKHADKVAEQQTKRKADVGKFFEKKTDVQAENAEKQGAVDRRESLNRGVERLDTEFKDNLKAARDKAHTTADAKYQALNATLDPVEANPEFLPSALDAAMEKIKGSDTEPTILKDMAKKTQHGDVLTYRDLQGYSSELGRELTKGTLPGDVYAAYDTLQESIGDEMQRVAGEHNLGPQLADARASWRQLKQTFYDPKSPAARALKSTERGGAIKHFQGKDQTGVEALAKYDPGLAQKANVIRGHQAEAASLPKKVTVAKALPKLSEKPAPLQPPSPVTPETKTIGPAEIRGAKQESLEKRTGMIRRRGEWIASGAAGYQALSNILHGNLGAVPSNLLEGGIAMGGVEGISRLLESPKVQEFLTRPSPADIAQIPPELRGDLSRVVKIAQQKGIKVSPAIIAAVTGSSGRKVGELLQPQ